MKLQKPSWIHHDGHPIFSVDIHPTCRRFATGGQGADSMGRVAIWGMGSIEYPDEPNPVEMAKLICQLDHHSACVNSVRWSNKGNYLASGGDDKIIIIWELKGNPCLTAVASGSQNSVFGKSAQEIWKPVFTLRNHSGDILDLAWSPDDRYLASASVDNKVLIWDAYKFPRVVQEIQGHSSLVKGVTWDPVGTYLATQSDDQTLKIWRTSDWMLEHDVTEAFTECGGTTHVLRLDWSPDGGYLVSAHAMNCGGPTAQIVERDGWKTDKDFVGHRKAVVCVRFTRTMLQKGKSQMCYVALGSRDRSLSIWSTALKRPLVVVKDIFTNSVMDLAWSSDGRAMIACSGDGSVTVLTFSRDEIGDPLSHEEMVSLHQRVYGVKLNYLSGSSDHMCQSLEVFLAKKKVEKVKAELESSVSQSDGVGGAENNLHPVQPKPEQKSFSDIVIRGPTDKQIETRRPDGKRRITPKFLLPQNEVPIPAFQKSEEVIFGDIKAPSSSSANSLRNNMVSGIEDVRTQAESAAAAATLSDRPLVTPVETQSITKGGVSAEPGTVKKRIIPTRVEHVVTNGAAAPHINGSCSSSHNGDAIIKVPEIPTPSSREGTAPGAQIPQADIKSSAKRKRDADEIPTPLGPSKKITKPSVLPDKGLSNVQNINKKIDRPSVSVSSTETILEPMKIANGVIKVANAPNSKYALNVINGDGGINQLKCHHETPSYSGLDWTIVTPSPVLAATGTIAHIAAVCKDCTVHLLDLKGYYAIPPFIIPALPIRFVLTEPYLAIVSIKLTLDMWNVSQKKRLLRNESILPVLRLGEAGHNLNSFDISICNSSPVIITASGKRYSYSFSMKTWFASYSEFHSNYSQSAQKHKQGLSSSSIVTQIKTSLASAVQAEDTNKIHELLVVLAKTLAARHIKSELHALCQDLLGPTHSASSLAAGNFVPRFGHVDRHRVLREILTFILDDLKWQDFYVEFDEMLTPIENASLENVKMTYSR